MIDDYRLQVKVMAMTATPRCTYEEEDKKREQLGGDGLVMNSSSALIPLIILPWWVCVPIVLC